MSALALPLFRGPRGTSSRVAKESSTIAPAMTELRTVGRYVLGGEIAVGGMATVLAGWSRGPAGFSRPLAMKRLHEHLSRDPRVVTMFEDEARVTSRIQHPNVVGLVDVVHDGSELLLAMEYVRGVSLSYLSARLRERGENMPAPIAVAVAVSVLEGLRAAHAATDDDGSPLHLVHRDVSPQNVLVGSDGIVRLGDFGIAKAVGRAQTTEEGQVKGKSAYIAPEQLRGQDVDARTDLYAVGVMLWELLVGERLFDGESPLATMMQVLEKRVPPPSERSPQAPSALDEIVLRAIRRDADRRFASVEEMSLALEAALRPATVSEIRALVEANAAPRLRELDRLFAEPTEPASGIRITAPAAAAPNQDDVETLLDPRQRTRSPPWIAGAVALFAVFGLATLVFALRSRPVDVSDLPPPAPSAVDVPLAPVVPASAEAAAVSPATVLPSSVSAVPPEGSAKAKVRTPPAQPPKKRDCSSPFTIDAKGVKVPKPECF